MNFTYGLKMYLVGTDNLIQNSVSPFGAISPWILLLFPFGLFTPARLLNPKIITFRFIIELQLLAFIPAMFIITPNFNHWNTVTLGVITICGFGLYSLIQRIQMSIGRIILLAVPVVTLFCFLIFGYFGLNSHPTVYTSGLMQLKQVKQTDLIMQHHKHHLFIENMGVNFIFFRAVQKPVNTAQYHHLMGAHILHEGGPIIAPLDQYGYLRDKNNVDTEFRSGDVILSKPNDQFYNNPAFHSLGTVKIYDENCKLMTR